MKCERLNKLKFKFVIKLNYMFYLTNQYEEIFKIIK